MQPNAKPTVAPRDDASNAEEPAPTKMDDQHNKLEHAMPVRTHSLTCAGPILRCKAYLMCKPM